MEEKVKHYQEIFGLTNWKIVISYDDNLNANARTFADPRYYKADITFNTKRMDGAAPKTVDETIVHELIHIVMALYDFYADNLGKEGSDDLFFVARENAVSQLTHIMMRVLHHDNK